MFASLGFSLVFLMFQRLFSKQQESHSGLNPKYDRLHVKNGKLFQDSLFWQENKNKNNSLT